MIDKTDTCKNDFDINFDRVLFVEKYIETKINIEKNNNINFVYLLW